ncbi:hypothetical protein GGR55DRAFT_684463 [Xylaria sp. FL0064]|nr:hypothetical protein GGR55DRAFT_684463 [Xylaria sp. FL0064]
MSAAKIAQIQLGIIFAALFKARPDQQISLPTIYDLAMRPEYVSPLRKEICGVLAAHGGEMSTHALQQMPRLNSFMKESLRLSLPLTTTFHQLVERLGDPAHYERDGADTSEFDELRRYRRRTRSGAAATDHARHQFVAPFRASPEPSIAQSPPTLSIAAT